MPWEQRYHFFFFFQAEDGIRDLYVTGVQTCALPILRLGVRQYGRADGWHGRLGSWPPPRRGGAPPLHRGTSCRHQPFRHAEPTEVAPVRRLLPPDGTVPTRDEGTAAALTPDASRSVVEGRAKSLPLSHALRMAWDSGVCEAGAAAPVGERACRSCCRR